MDKIPIEIKCEGYDDYNIKNVYTVYVNSLMDSININRNDNEKLEEIRKELLCAVYHIEKLQGDLKVGRNK